MHHACATGAGGRPREITLRYVRGTLDFVLELCVQFACGSKFDAMSCSCCQTESGIEFSRLLFLVFDAVFVRLASITPSTSTIVLTSFFYSHIYIYIYESYLFGHYRIQDIHYAILCHTSSGACLPFLPHCTYNNTTIPTSHASRTCRVRDGSYEFHRQTSENYALSCRSTQCRSHSHLIAAWLLTRKK